MIAIVSAMPGETEPIAELLNDRDSHDGPSGTMVTGRMSGLPLESQRLLVATTGVGKAMAAMTMERIASVFGPQAVVMVGLAGALDQSLRIGDVVLAEDTLQYDLDASELGFAVGEVPYAGYRLVPSDPRLLEAAKSFDPPEGRLYVGRVLTGDRFVADPDYRAHLARSFEGIAVEMEGAAVGLVCLIRKIPFLLARTISDTADGDAPKSFAAFLKRAGRMSLDLVLHLLDSGMSSGHHDS